MSHFHIIKGLRAVINLKSEGLRKDVRFEKCIYEIQKKMYFHFRTVPQFQTKLQLPANLCSREKLCHIAFHF